MKALGSEQGLRWKLRQLFRPLRALFLRVRMPSRPTRTGPELAGQTKYKTAGGGYIFRINEQEAMLINWLLTQQSFSREYADYLMKPGALQIRHKIGNILLKGAGTIELLEEEIKWLLAIIPVTYSFGKVDAGFSLKKKLYEAYLRKKA